MLIDKLRICFFFLLTFLRASCGWSHGWSAPDQLTSELKTLSGFATSPEIGVDNKGNAIAVWADQEFSGNVLKASRYDAELKKWSLPIQIGGEGSEGPRLAVAQDGKAIVVWKKLIEGRERLFYSVYQNGWDPERAINAESLSNDSHPSVGVDGLGNAIVVWQAQLNANDKGSLASVIRTSTYQFSTSSFGSIVDLSPDYSLQGRSYVGQPEVAVNFSGKAVVVWRYYDNGLTTAPFRIQANTLQSGVWGVQEDVSTSPTAQLILPVVAVSGSGEVMAIWLQTGFNCYVVTSAIKTISWSSVTALSNLGYVNTPLDAGKGPYLAHAAFDHLGNGIAAWSLIDESLELPHYKIQVSTCQKSAWGKSFTLSESGTICGSFKIAVDSVGNGWTVFASHGDDEDSTSVFASRFIQEMNVWCVPELISTAMNNALPSVSSNENGNFHAIWVSENEARGTIQAARWNSVPDPDPITVSKSVPLPPRQVKGWQIKNEFATHSERINKITWHAPRGGSAPVSYRIYRDPNLRRRLAIIPAGEALTYEEPLCKKGKEYIYYLVTVDAKSRKSEAVKIIVQSVR